MKVDKWLKKILELLPSSCLFCGCLIGKGQHLKNKPDSGSPLICSVCYSALPFIDNACYQCGDFLPVNLNSNMCGSCLNEPPNFDRCVPLFQYVQPIKRCISSFKFENQLIYGRMFAELLQYKIRSSYHGQKLPQCILPVPLNHTRIRKRGYNQALEIARLLSPMLSIPLEINLVERSRDTSKQSGLSSKERRKNVHQAFSVNGEPYQHIALLDDVMTTGHTVNEISRMLKTAGAGQIDVWCIGRRLRD